MSSTQSRSIDFTPDNASTYLSGSKATIGNSHVARVSLFTTGYATFNDAAKNILYPNSTAHPVKADASMTHSGLGVNRFQFEGTQIFSAADKKTETRTNLTNSQILNSTKSTEIRFVLDANGAFAACNLESASITLYFTRYDFSAVAGSGVTSASVSSSTGYDGDSITFSCVIPTGYVFDGWYNGSTLVSSSQSYTHAVNGADLTLTAKAHQNSHSVNGTYNGSTKAILTNITGDVAIAYNSKSATLSASNASHTLSCSGKVMSDNVSVGSALLATSGKIMRSNLVLNYV